MHNSKLFTTFAETKIFTTMAQITTNSIIDSISGKLDKNEQVVFRTRNGKKTAYILHKSEKEATESQLRYREIFRQASANAKADIANPKKLAQWQKVLADPNNKHTSPYFAALAHHIQQLKKNK